ncbi:acetyltransferase [Parafrankia soli]|uniref:Acetyltransferase n=1 Tax=Parafrankia soli TaxID=2599596 RepID=A0A1S1RIS4_9ACTN|nr:acetyltransferase [Parafrankia soli]OHV46633.1 acetyltransferase [Parafrankia soli]
MTDPTSTNAEAFDEWAIVELMGHVRRAGRVREQDIAGVGFLRLDIPTGPDSTITQLISPKAIYAITPTTEDLARKAAGRWIPEPVQRWELQPRPAAPAPSRSVFDDEGPF